MKKLALLLMLASCSQAYFISDEVDSVAQRYKGFDEILMNISPAEYRGSTYYWVSYSKDLRYASSILMDTEAKPVTDMAVLRFFSVAMIIHTSFPPESAAMWPEFSKNYRRIAPELPANISNDANEIADLLDESGRHFSSAIASFSPNEAEAYLISEDRVIARMQESRKKVSELSLREAYPQYVQEYGESLEAITLQLTENKKALLAAGEYLAQSAHDRVTSEQRKPETENEIFLVTAAVIVLVVALKAYKKLRR